MNLETQSTVAQARQRDLAARRLAQVEFRRPLVIEAGAGSGKTATLVARVLAWTLGPGWEEAATRSPRPEPDEEIARRVMRGVLAITFTEAASSEMAERVGQGMRAVAAGVLPTAVLESSLPPLETQGRPRARALVAALDLLEVRTIHACCAQILRQASLDAGIHPSFRVDADGEERAQVVRELVEQRFVEGLGEPPDGELLALASQGVGPAELVEAVLAMLDSAVDPDALVGDPFSDEAVEPLRIELHAGVQRACGALEPLSGMKRSTNLKKLAEALDEVGPELEAEVGIDGLVLLCQAIAADHGSALTSLRQGKLGKTEAEVLGEGKELRKVGEPLVRLLSFVAELDVAGARRAVQQVQPLLRAAKQRLRAAGLLGFQDLLSLSARLLDEQPEVAQRLRRGYRQILVDEFQDTDPLQCRIVERLALDGPEDERPGLFIVGDPKQSIYGWRSADLQAYEDFVQKLMALGGQRGSLVVNFRSVPAILQAVDRAIAPVMREEAGRQPRFEALVPCDRLEDKPGYRSPAGRGPVEIWPCWAWEGEGSAREASDKQRRPQARQVEALALAQDIAALHAEGVPWKEIAILFRSAGELPTLVSALRDAGVPYAVERDRSYFLRREILDASALVALIASPHDAIALVGWLRSAVVGLPDAALLPLWRHGFPAAMAELHGLSDPAMEALKGCIDRAQQDVETMDRPPPGIERLADWPVVLRDAVRRLALLRQSFASQPADRFVDDIRRLSLLEEVEASRYLGAWRLANLDRFFRGLRDGLAEGKEIHALLRGLREGIAGQRQDEEGRPLEAAQDAVQLMTIHKSKGLGIGHIYLIGLDRQPAPNRRPYTTVQDARAWSLFGCASPGLFASQERARRVEKAEMVRLLYVAMTRAKERLILTGLWPGLREPVDPDEGSSLMDLLGSWAQLPVELLTAARELGPPLDRIELDGALLYLPGRWQGPVAAAATAQPQDSGTDCASPAQVQAQAASLALAHTQAQARMRRPWTAAPSRDLGTEPHTVELGERHPDADLAAALGTVAHRALELLDLDGSSLVAAWELAGNQAWQQEKAAVEAALIPRLEARVLPLLQHIGRGRLLARLWQQRALVLARELPFLLPSPGTGPIAALVGSIDLVLWNADAACWVVVDFKTDEVDEANIGARAAHHAPQLGAYQRALAEAWGLPALPRAELWFLRPDQAVTLG